MRRPPVHEHRLANGLRVLVEPDPTTPMAVVNVLYDVGSRDEHPDHTGFAHLFEHFMFEGSANIPEFDAPLQAAGGTSNAFTNPDMTNYYDVLPASNLDTALWLEADRMRELAFSQHELDTQIRVVCEEFKENYVNPPYGDLWHHVMDLGYRVHPYRWPTIGRSIDHVEQITLDETRAFFDRYYHPANAILSIAGGVDVDHVLARVEHFFDDLEGRAVPRRDLPQEPADARGRSHTVHADVPASTIVLSWPMPARTDAEYPVHDLASDVLAGDESSRLHRRLVKDEGVLTDVNAFVTGAHDPGLLMVRGWVADDVDPRHAHERLLHAIDEMAANGVTEAERTKAVNGARVARVQDELDLGSRAFNRAFYELLGGWEREVEEDAAYARITPDDLDVVLRRLARPGSAHTLFYLTEPA